eukprot:m.232499 g.232499  ORF g.232499 m.232499 type:complete len:62 (-) comp18746_c0_seq1:96-281(-)
MDCGAQRTRLRNDTCLLACSSSSSTSPSPALNQTNTTHSHPNAHFVSPLLFCCFTFVVDCF